MKKFGLALLCCITGLILLPLLSLPMLPLGQRAIGLSFFVMLLVYFLPMTTLAMIVLRELLDLGPKSRRFLSILGSRTMFLVFVILLTLSWVLMGTVDWTNDVVFSAQFAAAFVLPVWFYMRQTN